MKIVIPVSAHDKHLLPDLTDCLLKFGGLEEHPVIFFPTPAAKDTAYEHAERLGAETYPLTQDFEGGAPVACNRHFASVVFALAKMGNTDPFLWMELDMLPVKPRWAVALSEDYRYGGTPFRGVLVNMPFNVNGKITFRDNDQMMMGTGIYPPNMEKDERIKPLLLDLAKPYSMNPREPFDVYLRWPIRNIGVSHTELIADMWATQNYRSTPQGIVCESVDHGSRVVRPRGGIVSSKAALIHGCKDGSLADIILGRMGQAAPKVSCLDPAFKKAAEVARAAKIEDAGAPVECSTMEEHLAEIGGDAVEAATAAAELAQDDTFWGGDEKPTEVIPMKAPEPPAHTVTKAPVAPVTELPEEVKIKTPEVKPVKKITRADIEAALGGKKMRVNDLAEKLEVDVAYLIGTFPINGYAVAKAGWVQNTIPITEG
jgi:hypothetical protein